MRTSTNGCVALTLALLPSLAFAQVRIVASESGTDFAAKVNACVANLPATGGTCDARSIGGTQRAATTIALRGRPVALLLSPSVVVQCGPSANPCVTFGDAVRIEGHVGSWGGNSAAFKTSTGRSRLLEPANPAVVTAFLSVDGVAFWNADSATAPVVNLINVSHSSFRNVTVMKSLGPASLVRITKTDSSKSAYYNVMSNVKLHGGISDCRLASGCRGIGYELTNGANDLRVFGGSITAVETALYVNGASLGNAVTGVSFHEVSVETYRRHFLKIDQYVEGLRWFGGRIESDSGQVFSVAATGVNRIYFFAPYYSGRQAYGIDNGKVTSIP